MSDIHIFGYLIIAIFSIIFAKYFHNSIRTKNEKINTKKNHLSNVNFDKAAEFQEDDDEDYEFSHNTKQVPINFKRMNTDSMLEQSNIFYNLMNGRRTVRLFSKEDVPIEIIRNIIKTAGTSPSGAHTEPWTFVLIKSQDVKEQIREIIETEEEINYKKRMGKIWVNDLKPFKTNWIKPYLTDAPYIICVFKQTYGISESGAKKVHYYNEISVAVAAGLLLAAIQNAGLVALTSTPLNCGPALRRLLDRPSSEKLLLLLPIGYPSEDCTVPDLKRKSYEDICIEL